MSGGDLPTSFRRHIKWGDCDPAGVVYTPRFAEYVVDAALDFMEQLLGPPLRQTIKALDLDLPAKAISIEFKHSLPPDALLDMTVYVGDIRRRTFDLNIYGSSEGRPVFNATFTLICIKNGVREGKPIPDIVRHQLEQYRFRHEPPAQDS